MALKRWFPVIRACLSVLLVLLALTLITIGVWKICGQAGWITGGFAAFFFEGWISYERKGRSQ